MKTSFVTILVALVLVSCSGNANIPIGATAAVPQQTSAPVVQKETVIVVVTATPEPVQPTATEAPKPLLTEAPVLTQIVDSVKEVLGIATVASGGLPRTGDIFETPVKCEKSFNKESSWILCEPGVLLDNTAAWTIPGTKDTWYINVPEGGFTYFSMGEGVITIDGVSLNMPGEKGLNYLVVIRGKIDDTVVDNDLNMTAEISDFVVGHAIWSIMPPGAYVSHDWFRDQLVVSTTTGGTNCGATGCSRTKIILFDVDSHFYQMFQVLAGDLDNWVPLEQN